MDEFPDYIDLSQSLEEWFPSIRVIRHAKPENYSINVRRPYFRMRGKPVSPEQAFDIIRQTDLFLFYNLGLTGLYDDRLVVDNNWYSPNFSPGPRGWVRPDGIIGMNSITGTYPEEDEIASSMLSLLVTFPYLDMVAAFTDWDENPDYVHAIKDIDAFCRAMEEEDYKDFPENIVYAIWIHDGTAELMDGVMAREKYLEYNALYGGDEEMFKRDYYEKNKIYPADYDYLCRILRSYDLDPEVLLQKYQWTDDRGLQYKK